MGEKKEEEAWEGFYFLSSLHSVVLIDNVDGAFACVAYENMNPKKIKSLENKKKKKLQTFFLFLSCVCDDDARAIPEQHTHTHHHHHQH